MKWWGFVSALVVRGSLFAWLRGQTVVVFGAGPLLLRGLTAAAELSLLFLLTFGKPKSGQWVGTF